jgi:hypothetical protein
VLFEPQPANGVEATERAETAKKNVFTPTVRDPLCMVVK